MDLKVHKDSKDLKVLLDHKGSKDLKELVHKDHKVLEDHKVYRDHKVSKVHKVFQELLLTFWVQLQLLEIFLHVEQDKQEMPIL